jgi:cyclopropane-fatty-acyl-phospholipid synthase
MREEAVSPTTPPGIDRKLLALLRRLLGPVPVALVLGNAENLPDTDIAIVGTVRIPDRATLFSMVVNPEVAFGDAYSAGKIEMEGDLVRSLEFVCRSSPRVRNWSWRLLSRWQDWAQANTRRGSSRNIRRHYDLSNDFYRLWLDERMVYTCAYFPRADATLEEAQEAKLDLVCRKLCLRPGETVVEVGCGWGALAIYMAEHYGVRVKAFNISQEQIAWARDWAKKAGVASQVEFVEDDYRNVSGQADVFVSVGMLEHVGKENYPELGRVIRRVIGDTGRGFLHYIGRNRAQPFSVWIRRHIFPGAYAPSIRESLEILESQNYSVVDIENLRMHYAKTLEHWLARFDASFDEVVSEFSTDFARMWRLYLAGSVASFRAGTLQLFQVLFAGSRCQSIRWTREHLYVADDLETSSELWTRAM